MSAPQTNLHNTVLVGESDSPISLEGIESIATGQKQVAVCEAALAAAKQSENFLQGLVAENRVIYGVTTGYGPLADNQIDAAKGTELQQRLVYHLASGVGQPFAPDEARAIVAARLSALTRGLSAVRPELLDWMAHCLNSGLAPVIPEKGTVGASGDLTPLAHMALAFMGEGEFLKGGQPANAAQVLAEAGIQPITLGHKEGIALVNGTSAMTGIAALNGVRARRLLRISALLSVAYAEVLGGHRAAWHPASAIARPQPGQKRAAQFLWRLSEGCERLIPFEPIPPRIESQFGEDGVLHDQLLPQDAYSIRCAPQLLGAVDDMLVHHDGVVEAELSSVTDNPIVFPEEDMLLHAGNFFGQHVSFASDSLANAVAMLGVWSERQIARITDVTLNKGLPPFLQGNATGLNSGFMGAQVTASALVAEIRAKSAPASIQSVPTNGNNQDVVTMGTIAARKARDVVNDASRILAIEVLCVAQAIELRESEDDGRGFGVAAQAIRDLARKHSAFLDEDRPLSSEIEQLATALTNKESERAVNLHLRDNTVSLAEF
ncbi:MAG: aromatic amino acid ammonia-lyase [Pseudomonadota bacterium]